MSGIGWFAAIVVGGLAGWIASMIMKTKTGILTNILLGIVGAFVANLLLGIVGITAEGTWLAQLVVGLLGACLLIWIWRAFKK